MAKKYSNEREDVTKSKQIHTASLTTGMEI